MLGMLLTVANIGTMINVADLSTQPEVADILAHLYVPFLSIVVLIFAITVFKLFEDAIKNIWKKSKRRKR